MPGEAIRCNTKRANGYRAALGLAQEGGENGKEDATWSGRVDAPRPGVGYVSGRKA